MYENPNYKKFKIKKKKTKDKNKNTFFNKCSQ